MNKPTVNQVEVFNKLKGITPNEQGYVANKQVLDAFEGSKTSNSVYATLASLAKRGVLESVKAMYEDKARASYKIIGELTQTSAEAEEVEEELVANDAE